MNCVFLVTFLDPLTRRNLTNNCRNVGFWSGVYWAAVELSISAQAWVGSFYRPLQDGDNYTT